MYCVVTLPKSGCSDGDHTDGSHINKPFYSEGDNILVVSYYIMVAILTVSQLMLDALRIQRSYILTLQVIHGFHTVLALLTVVLYYCQC